MVKAIQDILFRHKVAILATEPVLVSTLSTDQALCDAMNLGSITMVFPEIMALEFFWKGSVIELAKKAEKNPFFWPSSYGSAAIHGLVLRWQEDMGRDHHFDYIR